VFLAIVILAGFAQAAGIPDGMYCGGNQLIYEGQIEASALDISVVDPAGAALPRARVQVQVRGKNGIRMDKHADKDGRLRVRGLTSGEYWLGTSALGFNLHYWRLTISSFRGWKKLRVTLSPGT
jgi:hypothetical protein